MSKAKEMEINGRYNWASQKEMLIYMGVKGVWHQFSLVESPEVVWCEVLEEDLHMIEATRESE